MRCVIQRVNKARVSVKDCLISEIEKGLLVLIGITQDDNYDDSDYILKKILGMKLFPSSSGKEWQETVVSLNLEILSVSQFTLFARTSKGTKPDFHRASNGSHSKPLYENFLTKLKQMHPNKVQDGAFGQMMSVYLENDGPVTIIIDSKDKDL
jgi:D-tyrosyl-tRNA(Tyr) deacylase